MYLHLSRLPYTNTEVRDHYYVTLVYLLTQIPSLVT